MRDYGASRDALLACGGEIPSAPTVFLGAFITFIVTQRYSHANWRDCESGEVGQHGEVNQIACGDFTTESLTCRFPPYDID